jgi:hypothetical protein
MDALMAVMSLSHKHLCNQVNYLDTVKDLLTKQDIDQFVEMCDSGVFVKRSSEYDLYEEYYEHVVEGACELTLAKKRKNIYLKLWLKSVVD